MSLSGKFFRREAKFSSENCKNVRTTRQCHLSNNNKSHSVRYDWYDTILIVRISEVSFTKRKNVPIVKILRFRSRTINNKKNNNNNRLPSKLSGWLANPGGTRFSKAIKEISQEDLNVCLCFYASARTSVITDETRTSGHNVRFLRSVPHRKTSVNVHSYYTSRS